MRALERGKRNIVVEYTRRPSESQSIFAWSASESERIGRREFAAANRMPRMYSL